MRLHAQLRLVKCSKKRKESERHIAAITQFLCQSIFHDFQIFVASGREKRAASIVTIHFFLGGYPFIGYPENAKYPPDKNCISCSRYKTVLKLAYLSVKMAPLYQKDKTVMKVSNLSVSKFQISFKDIKSSGKWLISV